MSGADEIELWFNIPEHEKYQASTNGRIRNQKGRILKPSKNNKGYYLIVLDGKTYLVHRIIAKTYIPNLKELPVVNHINGIKTDNRVENLEFTTQKENCRKAWRNGLCEKIRESAVKNKRKISIKTSKPVAQMHINGTIINAFPSIKEAGRFTNINASNIGSCCKGRYKTVGGYKWKYITMQELQAINEKCKELRMDLGGRNGI